MKIKKVPIADPPSTWDKYKSWFNYSTTILVARVLTMSGAITTFVGGLDFSPLWAVFTTGTDLNQKQLISIGIGIIGIGISVEIARRRTVGP